MLKSILLLAFLSAYQFALGQQQAQRDRILGPVHRLFQAMEASDSALLTSAFHKQVILATIVLDDELKVKKLSFENNLEAFKKAVASEKIDPYREPIYDIKIQQEGAFAQVWASYAFYIGKNFHHCGVDTFQLIEIGQDWKIFYLADTRQVKGCKVPPSVRRKYEQ